MEIKDTVIEILEEFCPGADCRTCTTLVEQRHLDSLTMVAFVAELEDAFDIEIPPVEIVAENFNSADAIVALVARVAEEELD